MIEILFVLLLGSVGGYYAVKDREPAPKIDYFGAWLRWWDK